MVLSRMVFAGMLLLWPSVLHAQSPRVDAPSPPTVATPMPSPEQARLGFALACGVEACRRAADGSGEWILDAPPRVAALRGGSAAEKGGLRVGDRIVRVDGTAVTGLRSRALQRLLLVERTLRLDVERGGKSVELTIR